MSAGNEFVENDYFGTGEPIEFETTDTYYDAPGFRRAGYRVRMGASARGSRHGPRRRRIAHRVSARAPSTGFRMLPSLERDPDGRWTTPTGAARIPLTFSLRASW